MVQESRAARYNGFRIDIIQRAGKRIILIIIKVNILRREVV